MKRFMKAVTTAAAVCISIAAAGCGGKGNNSADGSVGNPGIGLPISPGIITPIPGGGGQILFSGTNVYNGPSRITGGTANWGVPPAYYYPAPIRVEGTLVTGTNALTGVLSAQYTGTSPFYPGTQVTLRVATNGAYSSNTANIAGELTLSPQAMQAMYGGNAMPSIQGLIVDFYLNGGGRISGTVYICDQRDQAGTCRGSYVNF